ncbi:hypothetical protein PIB30_019204 [Stylosanthes scabra]|uniref:Uncharacterized protein n=1 Tax=Stylosanthes scabra TaxID=79078 RepID=A0ABU6Q800_9FABA|nr:hypothetical protein [Stylosanthes scabra]
MKVNYCKIYNNPDPKHSPPPPPNHHRPSPTPTHHRTALDLCTATERKKTPLLPPRRPPSSPPSVAGKWAPFFVPSKPSPATACRRAVTGEVATITACHLFNRVVDTVVDRVREARGKKSVNVRKAKRVVCDGCPGSESSIVDV